MGEPVRLSVGHLRAVDDRCVIQLVDQYHVSAAHEARNEAEVGLIAGGKHQRAFFAQEIGQPSLELLMKIERPVEEPAPRTTRPVTLQGVTRRFQHLRVMSEAQVVVGPHHDAPFALDHYDRVLRFGDGLEIRVQSRSLDFASFGEILALVEELDVL